MTRKIWKYLAVGIISVGLLSGCLGQASPTGKNTDFPHDAPSGGQTLAEMEATVLRLAGIEKAEIGGYDQLNLKGNIGVGIDIDLDPDYEIVDGPAFITFLVESAWSVREGYMPNTNIRISVRTAEPYEFDAKVAAYEAGWVRDLEPTRVSEWNHGWSSESIWLREQSDNLQGLANLQRLGPWPGDAPEIPWDAIVLKE